MRKPSIEPGRHSSAPEQYRILFEAHPQPMWIYDPETLRFLAVNEAAIAHYGYSRDQFLNMTIADIRPVEDRATLFDKLARIPDGPEKSGMWQHQLRNGHIIFVEISSHPLDFEGRQARLVMAHDVTALHLANEDLRAVASRFESFMKYLPGVAFIKDETGRYVYVNAAWENLFGKDAAEALGETDEQLFPPAMAAQFRRNDLQIMSSGKASLVHEQVEQNDGVHYWLVSKFPIEDDERSVRLLGGTAIDVTRQHNAEQVLREQAEQLREREQLLRMAGRMAHLGGWVVDLAEGRVIWSDEVAAIHDEPPGTSPTLEQDIDYYAPEFRQRITTVFNACAQQGIPFDEELQIITAKGRRAWVRTIGQAVRDADGKIVRVQGAFQDITDRLALEEQLRQSQRLEAIGQLTGGLAHDFNNLLTVILGNAEQLAELLADRPGLQELAALTCTAAQRGAELTQRLLAFARRQPLEPRTVDIDRLVAGMDGLLRRTLSEDIDIRFTRSSEPWPALVDPAQLEAALLNLAINARDAMPGGGRLTIETANVELDRDYADRHADVTPGDYVMLAISDTGTGIPPEHLERVFEPFFSTKSAGKGTGLGLSMVYGFVKQSRGHIKIYSETEQGTTVKLYLPRADQVEEVVHEPGVPASDAPGSETVLVVEDDDLVRGHVEAQLTLLDYRVITARNAPEALEVLRSDTPIDLLFTDVIMPGGMNGRELAETAAALRPELKILYTSGYTENAIIHHGRLDEGVHLLQKPYRRADLAHKIRAALSGSTD